VYLLSSGSGGLFEELSLGRSPLLCFFSLFLPRRPPSRTKPLPPTYHRDSRSLRPPVLPLPSFKPTALCSFFRARNSLGLEGYFQRCCAAGHSPPDLSFFHFFSPTSPRSPLPLFPSRSTTKSCLAKNEPFVQKNFPFPRLGPLHSAFSLTSLSHRLEHAAPKVVVLPPYERLAASAVGPQSTSRVFCTRSLATASFVEGCGIPPNAPPPPPLVDFSLS